MAFIKFCSSYLFIDQSLSMTQLVKMKKGSIQIDAYLFSAIKLYQAMT